MKYILKLLRLFFSPFINASRQDTVNFAKEHLQVMAPVVKRNWLTGLLITIGVLAFNIFMPLWKLDLVLAKVTGGGGGGHGYAATFVLVIIGSIYGLIFLVFFPLVITFLAQKNTYNQLNAGLWNHNRSRFAKLLMQFAPVQNSTAGLQYDVLKDKLPGALRLIFRKLAGKVPVLKQLPEAMATADCEDKLEQLTNLLAKEKKISPVIPVLLWVFVAADIFGVWLFIYRT